MSKIKIKTVLKKKDRTTINCYDAIKQNNKILYHDDLCSVTISLGETITITRENEEYKIQMSFQPNQMTKSEYLLKGGCGSVFLETFTYFIIQGEHKITIQYQVTGSEKIEFSLEEEI